MGKIRLCWTDYVELAVSLVALPRSEPPRIYVPPIKCIPRVAVQFGWKAYTLQPDGWVGEVCQHHAMLTADPPPRCPDCGLRFIDLLAISEFFLMERAKTTCIIDDPEYFLTEAVPA